MQKKPCLNIQPLSWKRPATVFVRRHFSFPYLSSFELLFNCLPLGKANIRVRLPTGSKILTETEPDRIGVILALTGLVIYWLFESVSQMFILYEVLSRIEHFISIIYI